MVESKILQSFFEERHRKFRMKLYSLPKQPHSTQEPRSDYAEWVKHKTEVEMVTSHPLGVAPPEATSSSKAK